jgi:serine/threonine protein phosphatase PrpC
LFTLRTPSPIPDLDRQAAAARLAAATSRSGEPSRTPPDEELPIELDGPEAVSQEHDGAATMIRPSDLSNRQFGLDCLDVAVATSPGLTRTRNEDSLLVQHIRWSNLDQRREMALVVVADGLGGHEAGDKASGLAIRTIGAALAPLFSEALNNTSADFSAARLSDAIDLALQEANRVVYAAAISQAQWRGMGATVAAILIVDGQAVVGHVGDCRVYHVAGEELRQVTRDQTLVARMVELGQLSEEEALSHPSRNEVTHAVGRHAELVPAFYELKLATGDWLLAASDGLHAHVNPKEMQDALRQTPSALVLAHYLVRLAEEGGGTDNCTVAAIRLC